MRILIDTALRVEGERRNFDLGGSVQAALAYRALANQMNRPGR